MLFALAVYQDIIMILREFGQSFIISLMRICISLLAGLVPMKCKMETVSLLPLQLEIDCSSF